VQEGYAAIREPCKEVQCAFRLINILFSDEFASDFATIGNVAEQIERFWILEKLAMICIFGREYNRHLSNPGNELYNQLQFVDNEDLFDSMHHINPGNIVFHDWKKLRSIWKSVNAAYKGALARFTVSGTHTSDFFSFCNGNLETYYLRLHLQCRPQLNGMVEADLPADCFLASEKFGGNKGTSSDTTTNRTSSTGSGGNSV
jgi:hypothetical protein